MTEADDSSPAGAAPIAPGQPIPSATPSVGAALEKAAGFLEERAKQARTTESHLRLRYDQTDNLEAENDADCCAEEAEQDEEAAATCRAAARLLKNAGVALDYCLSEMPENAVLRPKVIATRAALAKSGG